MTKSPPKGPSRHHHTGIRVSTDELAGMGNKHSVPYRQCLSICALKASSPSPLPALSPHQSSAMNLKPRGWVPAQANEAGDTDLLGAGSLPLPIQCRPDHRRTRGVGGWGVVNGSVCLFCKAPGSTGLPANIRITLFASCR